MIDGKVERYSGLHMVIHWLIAVAVIVNWRIAEAGEHAATDAERSAVMGNHFALGVVIFILVVIRVAVRATGSAPARPSTHAAWERVLARTTHTLLYVLLLVMPLAGWLAMSKYGAPIDIWGIFSVPPLPVAPDPEGAKAIFETHALAGTILLVLIGLHVLGTLKHTLIDKDGNIFRMLPFGRPKA